MSAKEIEILKERLLADPLDKNAFVALRNLYMRSGEFAELAQLFEMRGSRLGTDPESADLYYRAAEIWLDQLGDIARGTTDLLQALEIASNHRPSAERLEKIYREAGDYASLLQVLTRYVEGLETYEPGRESAKTRSRIYQQIGEIWETYYQRADAAISFYRKAAQADPTNVMAIYLARNIYLNAGDNETASRLYEMEINAEPDPERKKALLRELAILKERNLQDIEGAIVTLRRAMVLGPNDPDVLYELGTAIIRKNNAEELCREEFELAADCFYKLSQLSDGNIASRYLETSLDLLPTHQGALEMYEKSCVAEGRWEDLKMRLQRSLECTTDKKQNVPLLRKLGKLTFEKLNKPIESLAYMEALEELGDPADLDLLARIRRSLGSVQQKVAHPGQLPEVETIDQFMATSRQPVSKGDQEAAGAAMGGLPLADEVAEEVAIPSLQVAQVDEEKVARPLPEGIPGPPPLPIQATDVVVTPKEEVDREQLARLKSDAEKLVKLGMPEKAEEKMRKVLSIAPDDQQAWSFLEKRMRAGGRFPQLRDLLVEIGHSPHLPRETRLQKLREAAALSETRLRDIDSTIGVYRKILALDPSNQEAREHFAKLLVMNKKWDEYVNWLEETSYEITDPGAKMEVYKKISEIHLLRRDDPRSATEYLWRVLELKPGDREVMERLDELALRMRNWTELEKILKMELEHEEAPAERQRLFVRLLSLQEETLGNVRGAYETCRVMAEEKPDDFDVLRIKARLEEKCDHHEELIKTLEKIAATTADPNEKAECLKKLGRIMWDQFDDAQKSIENLEKYFEIVPDDMEAFGFYADLLERLGRFEELISIYKRMLGQERLKDHHRFLMKKLAMLLGSKQVGRRSEAMEVWRKLLEGGDDVEVLRALAVWERENERWDELVSNLKRQLKLVEKVEGKVVLLKEISEIVYEKLGKPDEAVELLRQAVQLGEKDMEALSMLRSILAELRQYREAAQILEKEIALIEDAEIQLGMLQRLGGWYRDELGDKLKATGVYERILQLRPSDKSVLDVLEKLYEETAEWEKLLGLLRSRARDAKSEADILGLLLRGAKISEEVVRDNIKAWSWFREIFARITIDEDIMTVIEKAAQRMEQWQDLAAMYEELAARESDRGEKVRMLRRAAAILATNLGANERALEDIYQASLLSPDMVELLDEADRYAIACKDWERLAQIYDWISRNISDVDGRVELLCRFATIVWKKGGHAAGAVMPLLHATEEKPEDAALFDEFHKAALEAGEYDVLLEALDKRFKATANEEEGIILKLKMARIMAEYLNNVEAAIHIIRETVEVDPASERFLELILEVAKSIEGNLPPGGRGYVFPWLLKTYKQHADNCDINDPYRVIFLKQLGKIYRDGLEDKASAFSIFRDAHKLAPADMSLLDALEQIASTSRYWEELAEHYGDILRLSMKMEIAKVIHENRARILEEHLGRHEEAAEHYWQIIQCDSSHPSAFRKLADFYSTVGRYNDLLMLLESEGEKREERGDKEGRVVILKEIARVWEKNMGNRFEAIDMYKKILREFPGDLEAAAALERLQKGGLGLSLRLGGKKGEEEEEEEKVDIEELRRSLLEDGGGVGGREAGAKESGGEIGEKKVEGKWWHAPTLGEPNGEADRLPDWEDDIKTEDLPG